MCKSLLGNVQGTLCLHLHGRALKEVFSTPLELHEPEDGGTDTRRLTTGIRSGNCIVKQFRRCANVYLHKPRYYSTAYYTSRQYGIAYCS